LLNGPLLEVQVLFSSLEKAIWPFDFSWITPLMPNFLTPFLCLWSGMIVLVVVGNEIKYCHPYFWVAANK
jgi:hypothetical protein